MANRSGSGIRRSVQGAPATLAILIATLVVFVVTAIQSRSIGDNLVFSSLGDSWILFPPEMHTPLSLLRAVGAMFVHIGPTHLLLNGIMIFFLGREIERALGTARFVMAYFISGVGASLMVMLVDPISRTAGASGAVYGLMAVILGLALRNRTDIRAPLTLILVNLGYSIIATNVSLWGHVGGLAAGTILAWPLIAWKPAARNGFALVMFAAEWVAIWLVGQQLYAPALGL